MKKTLISLFFTLSIVSTAFAETIASYNVLRLGQSKKDYATLSQNISKFDIVGLIEVMNVDGLIMLTSILNTNSEVKWEYFISEHSVGRTAYKEYFGYVFKSAKVEVIRPEGFYIEFADEFEREPYGVFFKLGKFDFVFVLCHLVYGKMPLDREEEARNLRYVYEYFRKMSNEEKDVIIAGDFNLSADNDSFKPLLFNLRYMISPNKKTTVGMKELSNAYDNIFLNPKYTGEAEFGAVYVPEITDYASYRRTVSDHLPVYIKVKTEVDDD